MIHRLYWQPEQEHTEVQVLSCVPSNFSSYVVTLDRTIFHPQGGGQPSDLGWIGDAELVHVTSDGTNIFHHVLTPLPIGPAIAHLDIPRRTLHSRLHSAGHLIGSILESYGWKPLKGHHWPGEARVVFTADEGAYVPAIEAVQQTCSELIEQNLPLSVTEDEGNFRQVGFGTYGMHGCGGTHVQSTGAIGEIRLMGIKTSKGTLTVRYEVV